MQLQCSTLAAGEVPQTALTKTTTHSQTAQDISGIPSWRLAVEAADSRKATDFIVLDLRPVTTFTDFFVICTVSNPRQGQAVCDEIHKQLKGLGELPVSMEGYDAAEWILMDYGDFLVHVFSESARKYYDLERLWRQATPVLVEPLPINPD